MQTGCNEKMARDLPGSGSYLFKIGWQTKEMSEASPASSLTGTSKRSITNSFS